MNKDDFNAMSVEQKVEYILTDMRETLLEHSKFLVSMINARKLGERLAANNAPARNLRDSVTKMVATTSGCLTDSRIKDLPLSLLPQILDLTERLTGKFTIADVTDEEFGALVKDIKQLEKDIRPVYDWQREVVRDLDRTQAALN